MGIILKQAIKGTIYSYLGIVLGFLTAGVLMPKVLNDPAQLGLTKILVAWTTIFTQVASLGYSNAVVRYFTHFRDAEKKHNGFLAFSMLVVGAGFLLVVVFLFFGQSWILHREDANGSSLFAQYYWYLLPLTFFTLYFNLFDNYCRAMLDSVSGVFLKEFLQKFINLIAICLYYFGWVNFSGFLVAWSMYQILPTFFMVIKLWREGNFSLRTNWQAVLHDAELRKSILVFSAFSILTGLSTNIITLIDQIMLDRYMSLAAVGIYGTCMLFGEVIQKVSNAVSRITPPIVVEAWKNDDLRLIDDIYRQSCLNQLVFGMLLYVGIVANLHNVFAILPPEYAQGYWVVVILGLGRLFDMATGINGVVLNTSAYYRYDTLFFVVLIGFVYWLNVWFIPLYGMEGAALAASIAYAIFNIFRSVFVYIKFGFQPFSWRNLAVVVLGIAVGYLASLLPIFPQKVVGIPLLDLTLRSGLITLLFGGGVYLFGLSPEVNGQVEKFIKRFKALTS